MVLTHQGIAISETGRLLDGQHRLTAIANTGISAKFLVATGIPDDSFSVLDTGSARTAADVLSIGKISNAAALAAAIRLYLLYWELPHAVWVGKTVRQKVSNTTINDELESNKDEWVWAAKEVTARTLAGVIVPGPSIALLFMAATEHGYTRSFLSAFIQKLSEASSLEPGNPILAYRNRCYSLAGQVSGQSRLSDYIKLFNAYSSGQKLKMFKAQSFPPMPAFVNAEESIHPDAMES